jgi:hypothetical protein
MAALADDATPAVGSSSAIAVVRHGRRSIANGCGYIVEFALSAATTGH